MTIWKDDKSQYEREYRERKIKILPCKVCGKLIGKKSKTGMCKSCLGKSRSGKNSPYYIGGRKRNRCPDCGKKILNEATRCRSCARKEEHRKNPDRMRGENNPIWKPKIEKFCVICGRPFSVQPYRKDTAKCCSVSCVRKYTGMKNKTGRIYIEKTCVYCGKIVRKLSFNKTAKQHFCNFGCYGKWLSENRSGENSPTYGKPGRGGKDHYNWKGGISSLTSIIRGCFKNKAWRIEVFKRDNYTCQICEEWGGRLHAHHIKWFSIILEENNIKTLTEALHCDELWDINNGITLCKKCHNKIHKKGRR